MILDTTFLIDLAENEPGALKRARELQQRGEIALTTVISLFEAWRGVCTLSKTRRDPVEKLLRSIPMYTLDDAAALRGAEVHEELRARGLEINPADSMIAGIALTHGETVLTRNVEHFGRVKGLRVEGY